MVYLLVILVSKKENPIRGIPHCSQKEKTQSGINAGIYSQLLLFDAKILVHGERKEAFFKVLF